MWHHHPETCGITWMGISSPPGLDLRCAPGSNSTHSSTISHPAASDDDEDKPLCVGSGVQIFDEQYIGGIVNLMYVKKK